MDWDGLVTGRSSGSSESRGGWPTPIWPARFPRVSISVAALAVSLSMMVAVAVMIGSFRETVIYWVGQTLQADLYLRPATRANVATDARLLAGG
jgi:hypothetical protein